MVEMRKIAVGIGAAAAALAGLAAVGPAHAQCRWNGYGWACARAPAYYGYAPGSQFNNQATYGYRPRGLPHPNGPQPGGGGCFMGQAKNGCGDE
jgi:hypothetical protein